MRPHLKSCLQFWAPHYNNIEVLEQIQRKAMNMEKGLKQKSCEEQLKELSWFNLEKRRLSADLVPLYNHLKGDCSHLRVNQAAVSSCTGEVQAGHQEEVFHWKNDKYLIGLLRELVDSVPLESLRNNWRWHVVLWLSWHGGVQQSLNQRSFPKLMVPQFYDSDDTCSIFKICLLTTLVRTNTYTVK